MNNPFQAIRKMYSSLNYYQFCEYLELDPDYSMIYWEKWQKLCEGLGAFDDKRIQKMLDFGRIVENVQDTSKD